MNLLTLHTPPRSRFMLINGVLLFVKFIRSMWEFWLQRCLREFESVSSLALSCYLEKLSQVVTLVAFILGVLPLKVVCSLFLLPLIHFCFHYCFFPCFGLCQMLLSLMASMNALNVSLIWVLFFIFYWVDHYPISLLTSTLYNQQKETNSSHDFSTFTSSFASNYHWASMTWKKTNIKGTKIVWVPSFSCRYPQPKHEDSCHST